MPTDKILAKLNELEKAFETALVFGSTKKKREESFFPVAKIIKDLQFLATLELPCIMEKLDDVDWHYRAYFRIAKTNGHSEMQHLLWAQSALRVIRRDIDSIQESNRTPETT